MHAKAGFCFLTAMFLLPQMASANDPNSGFRLADITPKGRFRLQAENVIRDGKSWNLTLIRFAKTPNTYKEVKKRINPCFANAPGEQYPEIRYGNLNYLSPGL